MTDYAAICWLVYIFAVLRFREVDEVVIVHILSVEQVTVLPLAQVLGIDAVGSEELLIGDTEGLTDGLSDQLGLHRTHTHKGHSLRLIWIHPKGSFKILKSKPKKKKRKYVKQ